jgi:hypothetical protein
MLLLWLDMDTILLLIKIIGLLRIPGVVLGVKVDISELKEEVVLAVSIAMLPLQLFLTKYITIYLVIKNLFF